MESASMDVSLLLQRLSQCLSGWYVLRPGRNACIYYRLIECRFESDDTTARSAGHYQRQWRGTIGIAIKNTRDNRLDYLLIRSVFVPYKIALTSPFRSVALWKKMNLIFRLIAGQKRKARHARPGHRYGDIMHRDAMDFLWTERAKFMCNMWRIASCSLRAGERRKKITLPRARARAYENYTHAVDKNIRREKKRWNRTEILQLTRFMGR